MNTPVHALSLKEKQRKEREALILQTAEEVLLEKGYHAMSMDEIATRVGVAKGTLYLHFARKDDLVYRLFEDDMERILHLIKRVTTMKGDARTKLASIFETLYESFFDQHGQLLYTLYNSIEVNDALREKQHGVMRQLADFVASLLDEGKKDGVFTTFIPTEVMMRVFFSMLSPKAYQQLMAEKKMASKELVQHVERIYFQGITIPS
ncbi:MAG TPA: TetR/AcrR family transcriptional regulator [Ktedonobacter sp.]|nr:TetR/AcrR family transcriptional regulator [Ktedonobacter sp.]